MDWLRKIHHENIVSLWVYCVHGETRFLVYEIVQNGYLESQLHGPSRGSALTWHIRMKIAFDVASFQFLHERCNPLVIHRDLKMLNILLDSNFNAKLSNFGLAITGGNQGKDNLKLSGTSGYVAPEYLLDGELRLVATYCVGPKQHSVLLFSVGSLSDSSHSGAQVGLGLSRSAILEVTRSSFPSLFG